MKIQVLSDLHNEFKSGIHPQAVTAADVLVLAAPGGSSSCAGEKLGAVPKLIQQVE
jgi:hypothetical protein